MKKDEEFLRLVDLIVGVDLGWGGNLPEQDRLAKALLADGWTRRETPSVDQVRLCISDPGSVLPRENRDDPDRRESISNWGARAVLMVLADG